MALVTGRQSQSCDDFGNWCEQLISYSFTCHCRLGQLRHCLVSFVSADSLRSEQSLGWTPCTYWEITVLTADNLELSEALSFNVWRRLIMALHISPTHRISAELISVFSAHSPSFFLNPLQPTSDV